MTNLDCLKDREPRQTKITARLNGQGGLLEELRAVIPFVHPTTARVDLRRTVLEENVLRRPSLGSRVDVYEKLCVRYFPAQAPRTVFRFVKAISQEPDPVQFGLLAYVMLLWNDALVCLLGCEWLAPRLIALPYTAVTKDIEHELLRLSRTAQAIRRWTPGTRRKVAAHYLGLLRDCGYATGRARKELRRPYIAPTTVWFGAQLVSIAGESNSPLPENPIFRAMGLTVSDVVEALEELRKQGHFGFQAQGRITHFVNAESD